MLFLDVNREARSEDVLTKIRHGEVFQGHLHRRADVQGRNDNVPPKPVTPAAQDSNSSASGSIPSSPTAFGSAETPPPPVVPVQVAPPRLSLYS